MRLVKHPPLRQLGFPQRDKPFYRRRHLARIVAFHVLEQLAQILSLHPLVENANKPTLVAMINFTRLERFARQNLGVMHRTAARRRQLMTQIQTLATLRHRRRRAIRVDQCKRPTLRNRSVVTNARREPLVCLKTCKSTCTSNYDGRNIYETPQESCPAEPWGYGVRLATLWSAPSTTC